MDRFYASYNVILGKDVPFGGSVADGACFAAVLQVALWRNDQRIQAKGHKQGVNIDGLARVCPGSIYSTIRSGLLWHYFDLLFG